MGIFKNMFGSNTKRAVNDPVFDYIVNYISSDDFDVDGTGAVNLSSDVFSIANQIAADLSSKKILSTNAYMSDLINNNINQYSSAHDVFYSLIFNMLIYGDGIALIENDSSKGTISGIQVLPTASVTILQDGNGLSYQYNNKTYSSNQILDFRFAPINSLHGSNPLRALKDTLKLSRASNQLLSNYLSNNTAANKTLLQVDGKLSSDDKDKLRNAFSKSINSNQNGCLVSDDTVKISNLGGGLGSETVKQLKANDSFKKSVCSVYGVPFDLLVTNSHSNGEDLVTRYRYSLRKYTAILEAELNNKLNGHYTISDPIEPLNASDVANLVKSGVLNSAEAKQYLGFN